ncbi:MAG TPA: YoaK family protein [Chthoniobacterales bacterium]|nr:YoaK family protein [Chthoniobacterales bacterium]
MTPQNENTIDAGKNPAAAMMNSSSTSSNPTAEKIAPYLLLGMTAVTGLVDAVSFLSLGSVFTANMTGNILILAFATARVPGLSAARSSTALIAFVMGAILGGRIMARASADSRIRFAARAFLLEVIFLSAASFCSIGYSSDLLEHSFQPLVLIAFTGLAMGTRNAAVRKLAIPDLTTTVLTLTVTGIAADSSLAKGNNPRLARRVGSVLAIFFGAAFGAVVIRYSISAALALATAISVVCSTALFRSLRRSDNL